MNNGRDVTIRVQVDGTQQGVNDLARVDAAFRKLGNAAKEAQLQRLNSIFENTGIGINSASREVDRLLQRMQRISRNNAFSALAREASLSCIQIARLRAQMGDYSGSLRTLAGGFSKAGLAIASGLTAAAAFGKTCLDAQIEMQRLETSYRAIFGDQAAGQLHEVYEQADRLGLKFQETAEAAKGFFAAGKGTALESEMQKIFRSVTDSGAALQLSTEEVNGALVALGQMISKGKVQAEELRGQLGERLPGAFQMAARAMGMTTAELDKFMADGKLTAEDLLPKLARALEDEYGKAAENAANTVQGAINRMETEWFRFRQRVMDSGPVVFAVEVVTSFLKQGNDAADAAAQKAAQADWLARNGYKKSVTPATPRGRMGFLTREEGLDFTPQEYENAKIAMRQEAYFKNWQKEQELNRDKTLELARGAHDKYTRDTPQRKLADLREDIAAQRGHIAKQLENVKNSGDRNLAAHWQKNLEEFDSAASEKIRGLQERLAGSAKSAGKSASAAAKSAAVSQADYSGELERARQNIESLQARLGLDKSETLADAKIRAEQKYQAAISKTNEELAKRVARGQMTQGEADALRSEKEREASLERQLAIREAEQKEEEKALKTLEARASFYRELETLSGQYGLSIAYQNELIDRQGAEWLEAGISVDDVARRVELMKQEISPNWMDGAIRGARKFGAQYGDVASQVESMTRQMGATIGNALSDAFLQGKLSAEDFFSSLISMAAQAASNAFIGQIFSGLGGIAGSFFGGGASYSSAQTATMQANGMQWAGGNSGWLNGVHGHAKGAVFSGGSLSSYSGQIVSSPTLFDFDSQIGKFAKGAGLMGEAGPEAILPLARTSGGDLGVQIAGGGWNTQPEVNITVINESGQPVAAQGEATPNASGGFDLQIIVAKFEQEIVGRMKQGKSQIAQYQEKAYGMSRAGVLARGRGRA